MRYTNDKMQPHIKREPMKFIFMHLLDDDAILYRICCLVYKSEATAVSIFRLPHHDGDCPLQRWPTNLRDEMQKYSKILDRR